MKSKLHVFFSLFLAFLVQFAVAQEVTVSGTVTDQDNIPLPGANVLVKGSKNGSQTDFDGNYSINASTGDILVFSYVGQTTVERKVGASNIINVALQQDAQTLDEVIVVAYGTSTEKDFTGSADVIKAEEESFLTTLSSGLIHFERVVDLLKSKNTNSISLIKKSLDNYGIVIIVDDFNF